MVVSLISAKTSCSECVCSPSLKESLHFYKMINPGQKNFFWSDVHARMYEIKLMYASLRIIFWKHWCQNCSCRFCRISTSTIRCQPEVKFQTRFKKELLPHINFKPEQKKLFFYFITKYNKRLYNIIPIRPVTISNLSAFFSEAGLTAYCCSWGDAFSKSRHTHFPNLNNKPWRSYDVILLKKQFISLEKLNKCSNPNKF